MNPEDIYKKNLQMHLLATQSMPISSEMKPQSESVNRLAYPVAQQYTDPNETDFNPKINEKSVSLNRGYEDLIAWKQKVEVKNTLLKQYKEEEEQREQTEQYVYTNPSSIRILGDTRSQQKVEDILLMKGEKKKKKIIQKEQEIYGALGKPQINDYQQSEYTQKNVYTRLYDKALNAQQQQIEEKKREQEKQEKKRAFLAKEQEKKLEMQQSGTTNWNVAFKQPQNVISKPKSSREKVDEQQKLMDLMKYNFEQAKQNLLLKKQLVEDGQNTVQLQSSSDQQQKILNQLTYSQSLQYQNSASKQLDFGTSAKKDTEEQLLISNFINFEEEAKKRSQISQNLLHSGSQSQEEIQHIQQQQHHEEAKKDNRIIFLTPGGNKSMDSSPISQQQTIGINVMNPKFALLSSPGQNENKNFYNGVAKNNQYRQKSHDASDIQSLKINQLTSKAQNKNNSKAYSKNMNKSSSSVLSVAKVEKPNQNDEIIEIKASPQFKQFFKPVAWSIDAARQLAENNRSLEQINHENEISSKQAIRGTQGQLEFNSKESFGQITSAQIKQSFAPSPQQQSLQNIQNIQNTNSKVQFSQQKITQQQDQSHDQSQTQTILPVAQQVSQNFLYSKTLNKQLEDSMNNVNYLSNPKHVYIDFKDQNMHSPKQEIIDPYQKKLQQQQNKVMTQKDIEEQQRKLKQWQDKKDNKLITQRLEKESKELKGCTFKPDVKPLTSTAKKSLMLSTSGEQQLKLVQGSPSKSKVDSYLDARKQQQELKKTLTKQSVNTYNTYETIGDQKQELIQPQLQQQIQQHLQQHQYYESSLGQQTNVKQYTTESQIVYNLTQQQEVQQAN